MMKSLIYTLTVYYPMFINITLILLMSIPSKINKFHPMFLMLTLITSTLLISLKLNFMYNSWMSYLLFLIMIGGLMIIYMYISSLSNNEMLFLNLNMMKMNFLKISLLTMIIMMMFYNKIKYFNLQDSWKNEYLFMFDNMNINLMYKENTNKSSYYLMWYLYYTMICVMNICYKNKMPLRQLMI